MSKSTDVDICVFWGFNIVGFGEKRGLPGGGWVGNHGFSNLQMLNPRLQAYLYFTLARTILTIVYLQ